MKPQFNILASVLTTAAFVACCMLPGLAAAQQEPDQQPYPQPDLQQEQQQDGTDSLYEDDDLLQPQQNVDFNTFYNDLSPYGSWEDDPDYGQVWSCADPKFTPYYSDGNWAYTDAGWAWNSTYSWGWAPFHYGRWAYKNGWLWVPGYQWAPAWVSWRSGGGYYGWAPLGPGISVGVGVGYGGYIAANHWNFCQAAYITSAHFTNYCVGRAENINIIRNTTVINRVGVYGSSRFVSGPERSEVERYTGSRINTVAIHNSTRAAGNYGFNRNGANVRQNTYNQARAFAGQGNNAQQQYTTSRQLNNNTKPRQNNGFAQTQATNVQRQQFGAQQFNRQPAYNNNSNGQYYQQAPQRQYQAQQPAYNNSRPQYQAQQPARQPVYNTNRPQYQAPQRSGGNAGNGGFKGGSAAYGGNGAGYRGAVGGNPSSGRR